MTRSAHRIKNDLGGFLAFEKLSTDRERSFWTSNKYDSRVFLTGDYRIASDILKLYDNDEMMMVRIYSENF